MKEPRMRDYSRSIDPPEADGYDYDEQCALYDEYQERIQEEREAEETSNYFRELDSGSHHLGN